MKNFLLVCICLFSLMRNDAYSQMSLSLISKDSLTPNLNDTIGAFSRVFYHQERDRFYLVYAARLYGQASPAGVLNHFSWIELDNTLSETGTTGILPGQTGAGDFAMVMVDTNYFHLTVHSSGDYLLSKYDDDFSLIDQVVIPLDPCESNIDQLMNYTNGKLIIGAMYDSGVCPPINPPSLSLMPYSDIYQYDLDLNEIAAPVLLSVPSKVTWGASMIYQDGFYYEVTMNNFNDRDLHAFKYDNSFNYVSSVLLDNDGQWSQGVISDGTNYYIAYHTGDHNHGNIRIKIFDNGWNLLYMQEVTDYLVPVIDGTHSYNANRPFLLKKDNLLYISYDVESYDMPVNNKDWQAHLDVYQINGIAGVTSFSTETDFEFFPNPTEDYLMISTSESNFRIEIRALNGELVKVINNQKNIYVDDLDAGTYLIEHITELGKSVKLFVKK